LDTRVIRHRVVVLGLVATSSVALAQPQGAPPPPEEPPVDQTVVPIPPEQPPADPPVAPEPQPQPQPLPQVQAPPPVMPAPPELTDEAREAAANYTPVTVRIGGYLQPQFRLRENSLVQNDEDGFRFARVRPIFSAGTYVGNLEVGGLLELELQPQVITIDAYATVQRKLPHGGTFRLDFGQMRTPISRMQLISDQNTSFVDKAQIATIAHDRDFGARVTIVPPKLPQLKIIAGSFNGEGINQLTNINESFLHAVRVELAPFGRHDPLFDAFAGKFLTLGLSYGHNKLTRGDFKEIVQYRGIDLTGAYKGLSGSIEYLEVLHDFEGSDPTTLSVPFKANGWSAQLAYVLPIKLPPFKRGRFEIGARVEEIDRNDTFPIPTAGDPNQSVIAATGVITYYLREHGMKVALAFEHFTEKEDLTVGLQNATYDNDQLILQLTYRLD